LIPATVQIGGLTFTIKEDSERFNANGHYGETVYSKQIIYIRADMNEEMKRTTLIHEILHCLMAVSGVTLEHKEEEQIVGQIESATFRWLCENDISWVKEEVTKDAT
jgi:Zn-dependent peptidase ImmA (M78 family)